MTNPHSFLPPSSAARRMACPGSRYLESLMPETESEAADEGKLAHAVAAKLLEDDLVYGGNLSSEMKQAINFYVNYVNEIYCHHAITGKLHIEETITIPRIHWECFGTPDVWVQDEFTDTLHLFDFKYGFIPVEAFENWQLIAYASGIISSNGLYADDTKHIYFHIIQPRDFKNPIKIWEITIDQFKPYEERLIESEFKSLHWNAPLTAGSQCQYCKARGMCPALYRTTQDIIQGLDIRELRHLNNEKLGNKLKELKSVAKLIDAQITGLEEQVIFKLRTGETIPHFQLQPTVTRERWTIDINAIKRMGEVSQINLIKEEAITPKQAIKAGICETWVKEHSISPIGALKLVEVKTDKIREIFASAMGNKKND